MSDYDSNFTIDEHLGSSCLDFMENSLRRHSTKLASKVNPVQLSHLRSNLYSNFTIQAHLELVSRTYGEQPWRSLYKTASRVKIGATQSLEVQYGIQTHF